MPQISYRANLSAAIFPLSLAQAGRSVIIPGPDNNYDRRVDPEGEQKDAGIPQAIYLENILPLANGYQSIGHTPYIDFLGTYGFNYLTHRVFYLADKRYVAYFGQEPTMGGAYHCLFETGVTRFESTSGYNATVGAVYTIYAEQTMAEARGQCFFTFPFSTTLFEFVQLVGDIDINPIATSGITWTDVVGICGAYNYLIAVKNDGTVHWSSTTTPTDFTASLVTGAGSATPFGAIRNVTGVHSHPTGFVVTSEVQSFIGQYTGNSRYPWKFSLIKGTGPGLVVTNTENETYFGVDATGNFYAITADKAVLIAPELSSWLQQSPYLDSYNKTTNVFSSVAGTYAKARIAVIDERYLACSYDVGPNDEYNGVVIYDTLLRRYGNIKLAHNDLVPGVGGAVLIETGTSTSEYYNFRWQDSYTHDSVLALGKFQYARSRNLALHEIAIEGDLQSVTTAVLPSLNGRTFDAAVIPDVASSSTRLLELTCRTEAKNHTLVVKGKFMLSTLELVFSLGGGR